ncbi:MAG: PDZ domain-containing protein, partial [Prevotellaceae bacterium]|nr:PDZ domain-containing protein [Prevotellaceae bacterium]
MLIVLGVAALAFINSDSHSFQLTKNIHIFNSVVKELDLLYVDTIQPDKTIRDGIDAMLASLDPYTEYYPEDNQGELEQMVKGTYGGIGSVITYDTKLKRSMIAEPYEGMPAADAGLKVGDILLEIDGKDLTGTTNAQVSEMLRGQVNTSLTVKVERPGEKAPLTFKLVRKSILLPPVPYYGVLDSTDIGYINLSTFSGDNPSREFKQAFTDLKENALIHSLIIDLRNNGGGLLDQAVDIVNYFVPSGQTVVSTKGRLQ